jgi:tetratricopeptide (TPR) repeat protein
VDYRTGKLPEAVAHLSESIKIDPDESFAYSTRADAYAAMDEPAKALEDAAEAVRLSPTFVDMYALRAWIFATDGRSAEALQELAAMRKSATDQALVQWHVAQTYARLGRYNDAVTAMNQYVLAHPEVRSYVARANVRDPADAVGRLGDVELALAKDPTNADLLTSRAELLGEAGDHDAAIAQYSAQIKKMTALTANRRLLSQRGVEYAQVGKQAEARRDFAAALADDPDGDAYSSQCWVLAAARLELQSALEACDKALQVAPKDASYLDSRGFVLLQLGRLDEAIASYDAALALNPKQAQSLYGRGIAKNHRCHCADGDADMSAGARRDPRVRHVFSKAKLDP